MKYPVGCVGDGDAGECVSCELYASGLITRGPRTREGINESYSFFLYFLRKLNIINFLFHYFICSILYHILAKKKIFKNPKLILISQNQSNIKYFFFHGDGILLVGVIVTTYLYRCYN